MRVFSILLILSLIFVGTSVQSQTTTKPAKKSTKKFNMVRCAKSMMHTVQPKVLTILSLTYEGLQERKKMYEGIKNNEPFYLLLANALELKKVEIRLAFLKKKNIKAGRLLQRLRIRYIFGAYGAAVRVCKKYK